MSAITCPIDPVSEKRIELLHPLLRKQVHGIFEEMKNKNIFIRLTDGMRTFAEQRLLYEKGRRTKGKIVTQARPGYSWHNYGLALDICGLLPNGKDVTWNRAYTNPLNHTGYSDLDYAVRCLEGGGFEWGGNWVSFKDNPHFQNTFGLSIADAIQKFEDGNVDAEGYITIPHRG